MVVANVISGLVLAARLKALGVSNLIIERSEAVGEVWTKRYEYLSLHFPHWADHFPYFPYPDHWPTYTPAQKQGLYMQWYALAMELVIWTSSSVVKSEQDDANNWTVQINKAGETRTLNPKHVVSTDFTPVF
jgi:cation diffusion facilitator CzcD-associated flavoprotein CzcO